MILSKFALTDRVAIVTGSGRGIGKGIALGFAQAGAHVVGCARTVEEIEATADEIRALGRKSLAIRTDVRESEQVDDMVRKTVEEFGRIDILVNNAGGLFVVAVLDMSERAWDAIIRENLKSVFLCSKAVAKVMVEQKKGSIVNIASMAGRTGSPGMAHYGAAKAGIINLTQSLSAEWAPYKIRVNAIAPGPVWTPGAAIVWPTPELQAKVVSRILLGRFGQPGDIAAAAIYLASDASDWVTGQTFDINGGPTIQV